MALVLALVWVLAGAVPPAEVQRFEAALVDLTFPPKTGQKMS